jgi:hypothetical protein
MTYSELEQTIRLRVHDKIGKKYKVFFDNELVEKPEHPVEVWLRAAVRIGLNDLVGLGAKRLFRFSGVLFVQVFTRIGLGTRDPNTIVDEVIRAFRAVTENGITYRTPTPNHVGRMETEFQTNILCPFYSDDLEN